MYLIFKSKNEALINEMEAFFNNRFIEHPKNDNKNRGSAGIAKSENGWYFMYVAIRNESKTNQLKTKKAIKKS